MNAMFEQVDRLEEARKRALQRWAQRPSALHPPHLSYSRWQM